MDSIRLDVKGSEVDFPEMKGYWCKEGQMAATQKQGEWHWIIGTTVLLVLLKAKENI